MISTEHTNEEINKISKMMDNISSLKSTEIDYIRFKLIYLVLKQLIKIGVNIVNLMKVNIDTYNLLASTRDSKHKAKTVNDYFATKSKSLNINE